MYSSARAPNLHTVAVLVAVLRKFRRHTTRPRLTSLRASTALASERAWRSGAIVSPPDPVAPLSIVRRLQLPKRTQDKADRPQEAQQPMVVAAVAMVVNKTEPAASSDIGRRLYRKSRQLIATSDE